MKPCMLARDNITFIQFLTAIATVQAQREKLWGLSMICLTCYINGPFLPPCLSSFPDRWQTTLFKELLGAIISVWNVSWGLMDCFSLRASRNPQHSFSFLQYPSSVLRMANLVVVLQGGSCEIWEVVSGSLLISSLWWSIPGRKLVCLYPFSQHKAESGTGEWDGFFPFLYKCMNPRMIS